MYIYNTMKCFEKIYLHFLYIFCCCVPKEKKIHIKYEQPDLRYTTIYTKYSGGPVSL